MYKLIGRYTAVQGGGRDSNRLSVDSIILYV